MNPISATTPDPAPAAPQGTAIAGRRLLEFLGFSAAGCAGCLTLAWYQLLGYYAAIGLMVVVWIVLLGPLVSFLLYWATTYLIVSPLTLPVSLNQIFGVIFLASWAWWMLLGKGLWPRTRWMAALGVFFVLGVISAALGESLEFGLVFARQTATYFIIMVALATLLCTRRRLQAVIWIVIIFAALSALVGLAEFVTGLEFFQQHRNSGRFWLMPRPVAGQLRINGTLPNSIVFATFGLFALPFCYFVSTETRSVNVRLFVLGLSLLIALTALLTYNRQTMLQFGALFMMLIFLFRSRYRFFFALVVGIVIALMAPIVLGTTIQRLQQGATGWDPSVVERRDKIMISMEILKQKPLTGVGLGSFPKVWDEYIVAGQLKWLFLEPSELQYPDMGYMQMLAETGIVGFGLQIGLLLGLAAGLWRERWRALRAGLSYKAGLCSLLLSLLGLIFVVNFFQDFWFSPRHSLFYALCLVVLSSRHAAVFADDRESDLPADPAKPCATPAAL